MKKAVQYLVSHPVGGLLLDPGLCKTSITLEAMRQLLNAGSMEAALVVAPRRVCHQVWTGDTGESRKWTNFHSMSVGLLRGDKREKVLEQDHQIYVINPESLDWLFNGPGNPWSKIKDKVDTLVVDELSKFKRATTERFKTIEPYLDHFLRRWGLTGSPSPNGLLDLFGEALLLDRGHALGWRYTKFRQQYFFPTGYGGYTWVPRMGADEEIYAKLSSLFLRMSAEDYGDMPEQIDNIITVELPPKVRQMYNAMEEDCFTKVKGQVVLAPNSGVAAMKCRQMASGGVYQDIRNDEGKLTGRKTIHIHDAKTEALLDLVDELQGKPLLVGYQFEHDLERLQKAFKNKLPFIGENVSDKRVKELELAWNAGQIPVLAGQPQSMGHGLNLQGSSQDVAWYSLTHDYDLYDQFNRRVLRQGNAFEHVRVHHIVARDTTDADIMESLRRKEHTQNAFLDAMKERHLRRTASPKH